MSQMEREEELVKTSDQLDEHAKEQDVSAQEEDQQPGPDEMVPDVPDGGRPAAPRCQRPLERLHRRQGRPDRTRRNQGLTASRATKDRRP